MSECIQCGLPARYGVVKHDGTVRALCYEHMQEAIQSDIQNALIERAEEECGV